MARKLPPNTQTPSPNHQGSEPSEKAKEAFSAAEQKAADKREKIASQDAELKMAAAAGPSPTSSGMRVAPPKKSKRAVTQIAVPTPGGGVALVDGTAGLITPASGISQTSRVEAAQAAMGMMDEMKAREVSRRQEDVRDLMWYVRCHVCNGPGIWINRLSSNLQADDWAASYKPIGVMWPSRHVPCQCCMEIHGRRNMLKMLHTSDTNGEVRLLRPYPRMIVEIAKSEYNRLMAGNQNQADAVAN